MQERNGVGDVGLGQPGDPPPPNLKLELPERLSHQLATYSTANTLSFLP